MSILDGKSALAAEIRDEIIRQNMASFPSAAADSISIINQILAEVFVDKLLDHISVSITEDMEVIVEGSFQTTEEPTEGQLIAWDASENAWQPFTLVILISDVIGLQSALDSKATKGFVATKRITTGPYDALAVDECIYADTDGGAITVNLPAGINGKMYRIVNCGSSGNDVTVSPDGSEEIAGAAASVTLIDGEVLRIVFEPTENWW